MPKYAVEKMLWPNLDWVKSSESTSWYVLDVEKKKRNLSDLEKQPVTVYKVSKYQWKHVCVLSVDKKITQTSHEDKVNEIFHWKWLQGFILRFLVSFFFIIIVS